MINQVVRIVVIAALACACAFSQIRLTPFNDHRVTIDNDDYQGRWQYRFPEAVDSEQGYFLIHILTPMAWKDYGSGTIGCDWRPTEEYAKEAFEKIGGKRPMITGMQVSPRMTPKADRIDLELSLTNISGKPFTNVTSDGGCLQHQSPGFVDEHYDRSYILTANGLTRLTDTDRSVGIRAAYVFHPAWYEYPGMRAYEYFWGRSQTRPVSPLVVSESASGKGAIGIVWDSAFCLRQNSDSCHHCMHSGSYFGRIEPGQTVSRRGVILFADDVQGVVDKAREFPAQPYAHGPDDGR